MEETDLPQGPSPLADRCLRDALNSIPIVPKAEGERLTGADVRFIVVTANRLAGPAGCMIEFRHWFIDGKVDLKGTSGLGHLGFVRCDLSEPLDIEFADLRGLDLAGSAIPALKGMRARVRGSVYLKRWEREKGDPDLPSRPFVCGAGVDLSGAWIEGTLSCRGAVLDFDRTLLPDDDWQEDAWPDHFPFEPLARSEKHEGRPYAKPFCLNLRHTTIGSTLYIGPKHAQDEKEVKGETDRGEQVGGCRLLGSVDLSGLRTREFVDGERTYAEIVGTRHRVVLDGFEYERFGSCSPQSHSFRVGQWLAMQPRAFAPRPGWRSWAFGEGVAGREFQPQPYEQLAKVLKVMGHDGDAKKVLFARRRNQTFHAWMMPSRLAPGSLKRLTLWPFVWFFSSITGLGYKSASLVGAITLLVSAHAVVLSEAANRALIAPVDATLHASSWWSGCRTSNVPESSWLERARAGADGLNECLKRETGAGTRYVEHPRFNALFYAIESFFPVLNLEQRSKWTISDREPEGAALRWWMGFYTMLGWVGTSLLVAGLFARFNQRGGD